MNIKRVSWHSLLARNISVVRSKPKVTVPQNDQQVGHKTFTGLPRNIHFVSNKVYKIT